MSSAPQPQFDKDVYQQLIQLNGTVSTTAAQVKSLHDALLGENGHIKRLNEDVDRLYKRDGQLRSDLQASAQKSTSWRDQFKGGWWLVLALVVVVNLALNAQQLAKLFAK